MLRIAIALLALTGCTQEPALAFLELTIRDAATGDPVPARVQLRGGDRWVVPEDALAVFSDCGNLPLHRWLPGAASVQLLLSDHREVRNPFTGALEFYSIGTNNVWLPPGTYTLTVTRGIEHKIARRTLEIEARGTQRVDLTLERWIDLPSEGWWGADDHLHIQRPHPRFDPAIAAWMQAEDLHVANLLQMGMASDVHITPQYAFGAPSVFRSGNTLVVTGQENPRTHVLGHSIILGAPEWIDFPHEYLLYERFWTRAHQLDALNGYAHWAAAGAEEGLAVWGRQGLLDFVEVLGFELPFYERWYEVLDLGIRMTPTAGTDYPCSPSLPGRERFYTRIDGPLGYESWLDAVERGRTFVTNGPVLDLTIDGVPIGGDLRLPGPGTVRVRGIARFDPERDALTRLELVGAGGEILAVRDALSGPDAIVLEMPVEIERSTWLALRASGEKQGETGVETRAWMESMLALERSTNRTVLANIPEGVITRPSAAHTAPIWIHVDGTPELAQQPRAREVADTWLWRMDELEARFGDEQVSTWTGFPGRGDGIAEQDVLDQRQALLNAIRAARHLAATVP